jgi:hypothetical protein
MQRRTVLCGLAGAATLSLAGCAGDENTPANGGGETTPASPRQTRSQTAPTETPLPTDGTTPTQTPTPVPPNRITERALTAGDSDCGSQQEGASVSWQRAESRVTVTGAIWGNNTCYTAELASATLEERTLVVTVRATEERAGATRPCDECIVQIDYEATVAVDRGLPSAVRVVHEHGDERTTVREESF